MPKYNIRNCEICRKKFNPSYAAEIVCSENCKKEWDKKQKKINDRKRRALSSDISWANWKIENLLEEVRLLKKKIADMEKTKKSDAKNVAPKKSAPVKIQTKPKPETIEKVLGNKEHIHICAGCGSTFRSKRIDDKYCSWDCATRSSACAL